MFAIGHSVTEELTQISHTGKSNCVVICMEVYVLTLLVAAYHSGELFRIIGLQFSHK